MSVRLTAAILSMLFSATCFAGSLPAPTGDVILIISGNISHSNIAGTAQFDRAMLDALPQQHFTTTSPWTEGPHRYDGVLLKELLITVGAQSASVTLKALNDYHVTLELAPIADYPVLVAMKSDGKVMRVRDKGPLWLLYPMTDYPELDSQKNHLNMIWQLDRIEVE
ncbi:MAG: hypothetical protein V7707_19700 [Motiliproteus sp.]